ncbi:hypothetical protein [Pararhizobium gei]|nr:hypothetical protein [Rhizobium gei]
MAKMLAVAAFSGLLLITAVAGIFGWILQGPDMFLTLAANGLAWCL